MEYTVYNFILKMFSFALFLIAIVHSASAHAVSVNCSSLYQAALQEVLDIKEECEDAVFYDCCQAMEIAQLTSSQPTGIYDVIPVCEKIPFLVHHSLQARCDMDVGGGGWIVIQRRVSGGTEDFSRTWKEYEDGFGSLNGEFWYGLRNIHCLTNRDDVELRIDMTQTDGVEMTWVYQTFRVAGSDDKYSLEIGEGEGPGSTDGMAYSNGRSFTTRDYDNDAWSNNCAVSRGGGFWFGACERANPNGPHGSLFRWRDGSAWRYLSSAEMKIRPKSCFANKD